MPPTPDPAPLGPTEEGVVKWFDSAKGYGFVSLDDGKDVFVHMEILRKSGIATLREGEKLRLAVTQGSKVKQAAWVGSLTKRVCRSADDNQARRISATPETAASKKFV